MGDTLPGVETWSASNSSRSRASPIPRDVGKAWMDAARYKDARTMTTIISKWCCTGDESRSTSTLSPRDLAHYDGTGTSYGFIGNTALHWACANNDVRLVEQLLQLPGVVPGRLVNQQNHGGSTPLHSACAHGSVECVSLLMRHGVHPDLMDCCKDTAEDVTPPNFRPLILPLLRTYHTARQLRDRDSSTWTIREMKDVLLGARLDLRDFVEKGDMERAVRGLLDTLGRSDSVGEAEEHSRRDTEELPDESLRSQADAAKEKGNEFYRSEDFKSAIRMYTLALRIVPHDAVYLSNRSACYLKIGAYDRALEDAERVVVLRPDWDKAQHRLQAAREGVEALAVAASAAQPHTTSKLSPQDLTSQRRTSGPTAANKRPWFDCPLCENRTRDYTQTTCCSRGVCSSCVRRTATSSAVRCPFECAASCAPTA